MEESDGWRRGADNWSIGGRMGYLLNEEWQHNPVSTESFHDGKGDNSRSQSKQGRVNVSIWEYEGDTLDYCCSVFGGIQSRGILKVGITGERVRVIDSRQ